MQKKYIGTTIVLVMVLFFFAGNFAKAVNYDQKIKETEAEQKEYERQASAWKEEMQDLEKDRSNALSYIEKMDKRIQDVEKSLAQLEEKIDTGTKNLEKKKQEHQKAQEDEQNQYIIMKQRIKYMYENGTQGYWEILFGASSLLDFLNRSEYIDKIGKYDENIFIQYQKLKEEISQQTVEIQNEISELKQLEEENQREREQLKELKEKKNKQLRKYQNQLKESKEKAAEYTRQALEAEKEVEKLLKKKQQEIDRQQSMQDEETVNSVSRTGFIWPLQNGAGRISSKFGMRKSPTAGASTFHKGIDLAVPSGTPILASAGGMVVTATYSSSAGNFIMISHGKRMYTVYMHCASMDVSVGDRVTQGQVIARVGSTGISTGAHLHFGIAENGTYRNPLSFVSRK